MDASTRLARRLAIAVGGVVATSAAIFAAPAAADISCSYSAANHTVTANVTGPPPSGYADGIGRFGNQITAGYTSGPLPFAQCGAGTVFNTDTVVVNISTSAEVSPSIPTNLAPGFTDEPGSSDEIEIIVNSGPSPDAIHFFPGFSTSGSNTIRLGSSGTQQLVNLNAAEADGIDADVTMTGV